MENAPNDMENLPAPNYHGAMNRPEKGEGFPGQRIVALPPSVVERAQTHILTRGLLPTYVGWFSHAAGHLRERPKGIDQAIFIYCTNGTGWCEMCDRCFPVRSGELLVIPPRTAHAYGADMRHPWTISWFHAGGTLLDSFLKELDVEASRPVVRIGEDTRLLALFEEVLEVVEQGYTKLQLLYASQALAHLLAAIIRDQRATRVKEPTAQQQIAKTVDYMNRHINRSVKLDALASVANLGRSQYSALFKAQTGYAPIDYFMRLRMHRACQLLDTTELSIKQVADEIGFDDPLYFTKVFRKVNEESPSDYRKLRKG